MPDDSKKNQHKSKNDPKEQRRPRRAGHTAAHTEKKVEKKTEDHKVPEKPVYENPGPEFYMNLKRETDEILKITEEENTKYKKKEIQSNWTKYEMPIESYDEIEEQENMGADYEKLIQAPLSAGGHFQFKHEKSWDMNTGPSIYDKYFEINMDNLTLALSTIPFYERNIIDKSAFIQSDIQTMNSRSTRFKQKYFNDKSFITPEQEVQEKILTSLKGKFTESEETSVDNQEIDLQNLHSQIINTKLENNKKVQSTHNIIEFNEECLVETSMLEVKDIKLDTQKDISSNIIQKNNNVTEGLHKDIIIPSKEIKNDDRDITKETTKIKNTIICNNTQTKPNKIINNKLYDLNDIILDDSKSIISDEVELSDKDAGPVKEISHKDACSSEKETKTQVIESPEDLEKWLDDFLDS